MSSIDRGSIQDKFFNFIPQLPEAPTTFCGKHFTARLYHLLALPAEIITRLVDGILGVGGYFALVTGGQKSAVMKFTARHQCSFGSILAGGTKRIILFINPQAKMSVECEQPNGEPNFGVLSKPFFEAFEATIQKPSRSFTDVLKKASLALPLLITSVVDVIFGVLAAAFALVTLGTWTKCNNFASTQLNFGINCFAITLSLAPNILKRPETISNGPTTTTIEYA